MEKDNSLRFKQISTVFSVYLLVSLTFISANALAPVQPATFSSPGFSFAASVIAFINFFLPGVSAQEEAPLGAPESCCVKTFSGDYCAQNVQQSTCEKGYTLGKCSDVAVQECRIGTCVQQNGDCDASYSKEQCEDKNGFWVNQNILEVAACTPTCAVFKKEGQIVDSQFVYFRNKAEKLPQFKDQGLELETRDIGFSACQAIVPPETMGYCTVAAQATCTYTTRGNCDSVGGDFSNTRCAACAPNFEQRCYNGEQGYGVYSFDSCGGPGGLTPNGACGVSQLCEESGDTAKCVDKTCKVDISFTNLGYDTAYLQAKQVEVWDKNGKRAVNTPTGISLLQGEQACVNFQGPGEQHYKAVCVLGELMTFGIDDKREKVCAFDGSSTSHIDNRYETCSESGQDRDYFEVLGPISGLFDFFTDTLEFLGGDLLTPKWWDYWGPVNPGLSTSNSCSEEGGGGGSDYSGTSHCIQAPNNDCVPRYPPARVDKCGECSETEASSPWNKCGDATQCTSRGYCELREEKMNPLAGVTICTVQTLTQAAITVGIKESAQAIDLQKYITPIEEFLKGLWGSSETPPQGNNPGQAQTPWQRAWTGFRDVHDKYQDDSSRFRFFTAIPRFMGALLSIPAGIGVLATGTLDQATKGRITGQDQGFWAPRIDAVFDVVYNFFGVSEAQRAVRQAEQSQRQLEEAQREVDNLKRNIGAKEVTTGVQQVGPTSRQVTDIDGTTYIYNSQTNEASVLQKGSTTPQILKGNEAQSIGRLIDAIANRNSLKVTADNAKLRSEKLNQPTNPSIFTFRQASQAQISKVEEQLRLGGFEQNLRTGDIVVLGNPVESRVQPVYRLDQQQNVYRAVISPPAGSFFPSEFRDTLKASELSALRNKYESYAYKPAGQPSPAPPLATLVREFREADVRPSEYYGGLYYFPVRQETETHSGNYFQTIDNWWQAQGQLGGFLLHQFSSLGKGLLVQMTLAFVLRDKAEVFSIFTPQHYLRKMACAMLAPYTGGLGEEACSKNAKYIAPILSCSIQTYAQTNVLANNACVPVGAQGMLGVESGFGQCSRCQEDSFPCTAERCQALSRDSSCVYDPYEEQCFPDPEKIKSCDAVGSAKPVIFEVNSTAVPANKIVTIRDISYESLQYDLNLDTSIASECRYTVNKNESWANMSRFRSDRNLKEHDATLSISDPTRSNFTYFALCQSSCNKASFSDIVEIRLQKAPKPDVVGPVIIDKVPANDRPVEGGPVPPGRKEITISIETDEPAECKWKEWPLAEGIDGFVGEVQSLERIAGQLVDAARGGASEQTLDSELALTGLRYDDPNMTLTGPAGNFSTKHNVEFKGTKTATNFGALNNSKIYAFVFLCKDRQGNVGEVPGLVRFKVSKPFKVMINEPRNNTVESKPKIRVTTERRSVCRYSVENKLLYEDMDSFDRTGGSSHETIISRLLSYGTHRLFVTCFDEDGYDISSAEQSFNVILDRTNPRIIRAYKDAETLFIATDEPTTCQYSFRSFEYGDGSEMTGNEPASAEHRAEWRPQTTYFLSCRDRFGNIHSTSIKTTRGSSEASALV